MNKCEQVADLISGYIDHELTQQQQQKVELHLDGCDECRKLAEQLTQMQKTVGQFKYPEPSEAQLERIMSDPLAKQARHGGWLLLIGAAVVVFAMILFEIFNEPGTPWYIKVLFGCAIGGVSLLFGSVLRQRLLARKTDKYKNVNL
ncbi:MAG: zf-HC2 domain-containing protein [Algicola sp.]|nr:zf-HC2 domain-containing protein [Algicola sp.]